MTLKHKDGNFYPIVSLTFLTDDLIVVVYRTPLAHVLEVVTLTRKAFLKQVDMVLV